MDSMPSRGSENQAPLTRRTSPVFVDRTGRRVRRVRAAAAAGVTAFGLSLGLVVASMLGVPTVVSPLLPALPVPSTEAPASSPLGDVTPAPPPPPPPSTTDETADVTTDADTEASTPTSAVPPAPAPTPAPAPAQATAETAPGNAPPVDERGSSADAPGRTRTAPTPPTGPAKP